MTFGHQTTRSTALRPYRLNHTLDNATSAGLRHHLQAEVASIHKTAPFPFLRHSAGTAWASSARKFSNYSASSRRAENDPCEAEGHGWIDLEVLRGGAADDSGRSSGYVQRYVGRAARVLPTRTEVDSGWRSSSRPSGMTVLMDMLIDELFPPSAPEPSRDSEAVAHAALCDHTSTGSKQRRITRFTSPPTC